MKTAAVLPIGAPSRLLDDCLTALRQQEPSLDEIVVVDDSPGGALDEPSAVRLVRSGGRGPYVARNIGWRATDADLVLFLDVRSRPLPRWSAELRGLFADPQVALGGSEVRVRSGRMLAERAAERQQFFVLKNYVVDPYFRPYLPTCNLAVRRDDLEAVGGFGEVRSGGDADLCWRILERPGRRLAAVDDVLMEWVPRDRLRGYLEQNYRYGISSCALRRGWADRGAAHPDPWARSVILRRIARAGARVAKARLLGRDDELAEQLRWIGQLAYETGYRVATDSGRRRGSSAFAGASADGAG